MSGSSKQAELPEGGCWWRGGGRDWGGHGVWGHPHTPTLSLEPSPPTFCTPQGGGSTSISWGGRPGPLWPLCHGFLSVSQSPCASAHS